MKKIYVILLVIISTVVFIKAQDITGTIDDGTGKFYVRNDKPDTLLVIDGKSGNVGIGINKPQERLHIHGDIMAYDLKNNHRGANIMAADEDSNIVTMFVQDTTGYLKTVGENMDLVLGADVWGDHIIIKSDGNVGIGTDSPTDKLQVAGDMRLNGMLKDKDGDAGAAGQVLSATDSGINWIAAPNGADNLGNHSATKNLNMSGFNVQLDDGYISGDGEDEGVFVDNSGNVGIGTAGPGSKLDLKGTLRLSGSNTGYVGFAPAADAGSTTYTLPSTDGSNGAVLSTNGSGTLSWATPTGGGITAVGSMTSDAAFAGTEADDDWLGLGASAGRIEFDDQTTDEINILDANVGIGTSTPELTLDVNGQIGFAGDTRQGIAKIYDASAGDVYGIEQVSSTQSGISRPEMRLFTSDYGSASIGFGKYTNATSFAHHMVIDHDGNVGIGATTPANILDVNGAANFGDVLINKASAYNTGSTAYNDGFIELYRTAGDGAYIDFKNASEDYDWRIQARNDLNTLLFSGGNFSFTGGNVGIGTNGTDGQLTIYSEQGTTDYSVVFQPHAAMTAATTYTLPPDDGTASQVLTTDGSGALSWATPVGVGGNSIADADADTKIQVEESADEDQIRFDVFGNQAMVIDNTGQVGIGAFGTDSFTPGALLHTYSGATNAEVIFASKDGNYSSAVYIAERQASGDMLGTRLRYGDEDNTFEIQTGNNIGSDNFVTRVKLQRDNDQIDLIGDVVVGDGSIAKAGTIALHDADASDSFTTTLASNADVAADFTLTLPADDGTASQVLTTDGSGALSWTTPAGGGDITSVGSMTSGAAFADATADDDWLGLGASAGRIEFDDQITDEINILNANVGIGTTTPSSKLDIVLADTDYSGISLEGENYDASDTATRFLIRDRTGNTGWHLSANNDGSFAIHQGEVGDRLAITNTGNVGIGDTSPDFTLDVAGTLGADGAITTGSNGTDGSLSIYSEQGTTDYSVVLQPHTAMTGNTTYTLPADDGTASQVLTTDGSGTLSWTGISGAATFDDIYDNSVAAANTTMEIDNGNLAFDLVGAGNDFIIKDDGSTALHVGDNGTVSIGADLSGSFSSTPLKVQYSHKSTLPHIMLYNGETGTSPAAIMANTASNGNIWNVGNKYGGNHFFIENYILDKDMYFQTGNSGFLLLDSDGDFVVGKHLSSGARLEVVGPSSPSVGGWSSGIMHVTNESTDANANANITGHNSNNTNKQLWFLGSGSSSNDNIVFINRQNASLTLGVNNNAETAVLGTNGDFTVKNLVQTSDERFKANVVPLENGLDKVLQMEPVYFNWLETIRDMEAGTISVGGLLEGGEQEIGFLAQDLAEILPEAVSIPEDEDREQWGVHYGKIVPTLVKAIQEQQAQIEALQIVSSADDPNVLTLTTLSPHNFSLLEKSEPMAWSFYSENANVGQRINVDMLKTVRLIEKMSGEQLVYTEDMETGKSISNKVETGEVGKLKKQIEQLKSENGRLGERIGSLENIIEQMSEKVAFLQ